MLPLTFSASEHLYSARLDSIGIEKAGHFMHIEAADRFADLVIDFLRTA